MPELLQDGQAAAVQELLRRRATLAPEQQAAVDELARRFNLASPPEVPTTMPGTDIPIPGMPATEKAPLLRPPVERNGEFFKQTQMPFGSSTFEQRSDAQGLTQQDRDQQSMLDSVSDLREGASKAFAPLRPVA